MQEEASELFPNDWASYRPTVESPAVFRVQNYQSPDATTVGAAASAIKRPLCPLWLSARKRRAQTASTAFTIIIRPLFRTHLAGGAQN